MSDSVIRIKAVKAYMILDSRGYPTVEVEIFSINNKTGRAAVPSGASTGTLEALELRDHDKTRYMGYGVEQAISHIRSRIHPVLIGKAFDTQMDFDNFLLALDGTENKSVLGANAVLAVSLAFSKLKAAEEGLPLYASISADFFRQPPSKYRLPIPMMNLLNGGAHANNNLDIQEFMIMPIAAASFSEALRYGVEIFYHLRRLLQKKGFSTAVGDEGGFAPSLSSHDEAISFLLQAIESAGFVPGKEVVLALDLASSEFYKEGFYHLKTENKKLTSAEMVAYLTNLVKKYPIVSLEDPMAETDWTGWQLLTKHLSDKVQLVADDLFVTNPVLLEKGIKEHIANAILIKPNQIGTLTETLKTIRLAKEAGYNVIISHRSGETEDTTIADLAVGVDAGQIKTGSVSRTDRTAKYNQLLRIEAGLHGNADFTKYMELFVKEKKNAWKRSVEPSAESLDTTAFLRKEGLSSTVCTEKKKSHKNTSKKLAPVITIDGPGGSGKGTICHLIAKRLGWHVLDSGVLYRVLAYAVKKYEIDQTNPKSILALLKNLNIQFWFDPITETTATFLDDQKLEGVLYEESIAALASEISALPEVRAALVETQRQFRQMPGLVTDGRDMGTVIFPDARLKLYLEASPQERAKRRTQQLQRQGIEANYENILTAIQARDYRDQHRLTAPLRPATDAVIIDTSTLTVSGVLKVIEPLLEELLTFSQVN